MFGNSRNINSNQTEIHCDLIKYLERYRKNPFRRQISNQVLESFLMLDEQVKKHNMPIILDSGCGVGESTFRIAEKNPNCLVVGVDKSIHRLNKNLSNQVKHNNVIFYRTNLIDFWPLVNKYMWPVQKHYLLYPNPWPLKKDVKKRFHAHPIFMELIEISNVIELRSNWRIYLEEFSLAFEHVAGCKSKVEIYNPESALTPFERKYQSSGHILFRLLIQNEG